MKKYDIVIAGYTCVDRIFLEYPGCNQLINSSFINFEAVSQSRMFHFGYPPLLKQIYLNNGSQMEDVFSKIQSMGVVNRLISVYRIPKANQARLTGLMSCKEYCHSPTFLFQAWKRRSKQ